MWTLRDVNALLGQFTQFEVQGMQKQIVSSSFLSLSMSLSGKAIQNNHLEFADLSTYTLKHNCTRLHELGPNYRPQSEEPRSALQPNQKWEVSICEVCHVF